MISEGNILIFDNDDEFTDYCLSKKTSFSEFKCNGKKYITYDFPFTDTYQQALKNNVMFKIVDKNSKVMKHKCVNRGMITKPVENLCEQMTKLEKLMKRKK